MTETVTLDLHWVAETEKAYGVREDETDTTSDLIWLPKSQVEFETDGEIPCVVTFNVPEWLATEKGLV